MGTLMRSFVLIVWLLVLTGCAAPTSVQSSAELTWRADLSINEKACSIEPIGDLTRINWFKWQGRKFGKSCYVSVPSKEFESRFTFCALSTQLVEARAGIPDA